MQKKSNKPIKQDPFLLFDLYRQIMHDLRLEIMHHWSEFL